MRSLVIVLGATALFWSSAAYAQATFKNGHYVKVPHELWVETPTQIRVLIKARPSVCEYGSLNYNWLYIIPPNYNNTPIKGVSGTCTGVATSCGVLGEISCS